MLRARTWADLAGSELERDVVRAQLDRGPLAALISRVVPWRLPVGRYAWTVPPLLRLFEYAVVLLVVRAVAPDAIPAAFALLFAVAYHHYDALYRVLNGLPPAGAVHAAGLGVEGRLIVILALAAAGEDALSRGLVVMAVVLAVVFVVVGTMGGLRALRPGPDGARAEGGGPCLTGRRSPSCARAPSHPRFAAGATPSTGRPTSTSAGSRPT